MPDFPLRRRRLLGEAAVASTAGALASCRIRRVEDVKARTAQPLVRCRMATSWPHPLGTIFGGAETISRRLREMSDGRFLIQPFAAGELVPGLEVLEAVLMMETQAHVLADRGPDPVSPFCVPMMIPNMATGLTAIALGACSPSSAVATACAAGSNAIGDAFRQIQLGLADAMVCGGGPVWWCWRAWTTPTPGGHDPGGVGGVWGHL